MSKLKEKGITLVALVVTIIILLILAGVTISQIGGSNGLFSRVRQAVGQYKNASLDEEKYLTEIDRYVDEFSIVGDTNDASLKIKELKVSATTDEIQVEVTIEGEVSKIEYNLSNSDDWKTNEENEKSTTYTFNGVEPGSYYVRVKAYDKNNKAVEALSKIITINAETTADEEDVLAGETFLKAGETKPRTGTMTNQGDLNKTVSAGGSLPLPAGYYSGGTITASKGNIEFGTVTGTSDGGYIKFSNVTGSGATYTLNFNNEYTAEDKAFIFITQNYVTGSTPWIIYNFQNGPVVIGKSKQITISAYRATDTISGNFYYAVQKYS